MKRLLTTKHFNVLFYPCKTEGNDVYGFDILNKNELIKRNKHDIIEIDPTGNFIKKLMSDDEIKINILEPLGLSVKEQAKYLGITERTVCRIRETLNMKERL
jgi:hypothetical protein